MASGLSLIVDKLFVSLVGSLGGEPRMLAMTMLVAICWCYNPKARLNE
jgi:hypothetical protein